MLSTSRPTYPTSVYFVASTFTSGAPTSWASCRAISVLPTPVGQLLAAPAVANRDRHRSFGGVLADDIAIQLGDDFSWR
jgi:hypothetical protein